MFKAKAEVKYREFIVIVKGILATRLQAIYNLKDLLYILQKYIPEISRYRV